MKFKNYILFFINVLLIGSCNKQSELIKYNESIATEEIDGFSRDMRIQGDTLFVVNEDEGLLIYNIDTSNQSVKLNLIFVGVI